MPLRMRHGLLLIVITIIGLFFASVMTSYSETVYTYDELNRLKRVQYGDGSAIEYIYDKTGNRLERRFPPSDITPPTTTASPAGGIYAPGLTVALTCNDGSGSGCEKIYYTTDGSTPTTSSPFYSTPIPVSDTTLKFFATDFATNSESVKTEIYVMEAGPPTGTITINSGAAYTNNMNVTLNLTCYDAQGCSQMQFSNDDVTYSNPEAYAPSKAWTLTADDALKTVYARFKDAPGNWSSPCSDTIILDTFPPTGTITINAGAASTNSVNVTLTLTCNRGSGSDCAYMQFSNDGATYSSPEAYTTTKAWTLTPGDGLKTVYAKFQDGAGNWSDPPSDDSILLDTAQVRIGGVGYPTIQAAYNAAINGDTIKCREMTFTESLTVNRNINVALEGGYDSGFTTNYGTMTILRGMITTTVGGGTITIENFTLVH